LECTVVVTPFVAAVSYALVALYAILAFNFLETALAASRTDSSG